MIAISLFKGPFEECVLPPSARECEHTLLRVFLSRAELK